MNDDFNLDAALRDELTPSGDKPGGNESGKADPASQAAGGGTPGDQGGTPAEQATFKLPDGRMVTPTEAQRVFAEEFMPDYTRKSQELAELKKGQSSKQSKGGEESDGKDDSPIDQALAQEVDRVAKHLGYVKKDEVAEQIESVVPRTAGAVRAEQLLNDTFTKLESEYDGSVDQTTGIAKPKFDRKEIMEYVQGEMKQGNKVNLSPLQIAHILHPNEYAVYDAATLGKGSNGSVKNGATKAALPATEKTGNAGGGNPNPPTPKYDYSNGASSIEEGLNAILNPSA